MLKKYYYTYIPLISMLYYLFYLVPEGVNDYVISLCLGIFYSIAIVSVNDKIKINNLSTFIKFDTFFLVFYFLLFYLPYQLYLLGMAELEYNKYLSYAYIEYVNKSIILSTIGLLAFYLGYKTEFNLQLKEQEENTDIYLYRYFPFLIVTLFILVLGVFSLTGFQSLIAGSYMGTKVLDTTDGGLYFLCNFFSLFVLSIAAYFYKHTGKIGFFLGLGLIFCIIWNIQILMIGDRNTFFLNAVLFVVAYTSLYKPIKLYQLVILFMMAISLYQLIEITRTSTIRNFSSITSSLDNEDVKFDYSDNSFSITTVTTRAAIKIVENETGYYYGKFKLIGLMGVLPYSRGLFYDTDKEMTTSQVLKKEMLSSSATWGVGSNIISDLYIDFGLFGVIFGMLLLGLLASYFYHKFIMNLNSLKWTTLYLVSITLYSEIPRYSFDFPVRNIAWMLLLFFIYKMFVPIKRL